MGTRRGRGRPGSPCLHPHVRTPAARMPSDEEIYQDHILDHYEDPFHRGHLDGATHAHQDKNPLCGDVVRIELEVDDNGKISDLYFSGEGCVISQASASMLLEE